MGLDGIESLYLKVTVVVMCAGSRMLSNRCEIIGLKASVFSLNFQHNLVLILPELDK